MPCEVGTALQAKDVHVHYAMIDAAGEKTNVEGKGGHKGQDTLAVVKGRRQQ